MSELEPRSARNEIAHREYEGTDSIRAAATDRARMQTAVEAARQTGMKAREWLWNAREAERTLGRMITEAREAGDLAKQTDNQWSSSDTTTTLDDLGISRDLAAYAVSLTRVPDDVWAEWHENPAEPTKASVQGTAAAYLERVAEAQRRVGDAEEVAARARRAAEEARKAAAAAVRKLTAAERERPTIPPLRDDETSLAGADIALDLAVGSSEPQGPPVNRAPDPRKQAGLLAAMTDLASRIDAHNPTLTTDAFRDANVMAARDSVRRLVDSATVFLRTLNALYAERGNRHE